ncbi:MAG TPA: serine hydrolase [Mycobacteriales bacterium]|jgi:D-alanyl-D-alanine carboxypeptidase (penicillin-binding protein 5/6)|nr:serine hydrolase [Mycobacteriales bacterium]
MRARVVSACAAAALAVVASAATAGAAPQRLHTLPVGGPLLASSGVVENPLPGAPALPPPTDLPASSWMVTDLTTGQVLAAKDAHGKFLPASTLKTLTALTLLPKLNPKSAFTVTYKDATVDGTRAGLSVGMSYPIKTLFTCMLEMSANDAADALAEANGGIRHTVAQMNTVARKLQADDTHADTPSGLDGVGETTSAYDLALIAKADYRIPAFRHYLSLTSSVVPAAHHKHFQIQSHNNLLTTYRGDIGGKNGYTVAAKATYVGAATRHGQTMLVTLMHAYPIWWPMAADLLNWGFKASGKVTPVGQLVGPLPPHVAKAVASVQSAPPSTKLVSSPAAGHGLRLPWLPIEIAAAVIAALAISVALRRRQIRRRRYRPRLKLPPI